MIPKVQGYASFQSYSSLPYPALKIGVDELDRKQIWAKMDRKQVDFVSPLNNYSNSKTVYQAKFLENTQPKDYATNIHRQTSRPIQRGHKLKYSTSKKETECQLSCGHKQNEYLTALECKAQPDQPLALGQPLQTGTQHWNTVYQDDFKKLRTVASAGALLSACANTAAVETTPSSKVVAEAGVKAKGKQLEDKELGEFRYKMRQNSLAARTGNTEYRFSYGQRIGHRPNPDILSADSTKQPRLFNELKMGTTQLSSHIPGYQGFLPAALTIGEAFEQGKGERTRNTIVKNNLYENYHLFLPGFTGHKPRSVNNVPPQLRQHCLQLN